MDEGTDNFWKDAEVIHTYSRAEAIEDGFLIDVTSVAKEAGFKIPVAVTSALWAEFVALPTEYRGCQDESGRLWDVLWMARYAARREQNAETVYPVMRLRRIRPDGEDSRRLDTLRFKALCGPGDQGEPVITLMLEGED